MTQEWNGVLESQVNRSTPSQPIDDSDADFDLAAGEDYYKKFFEDCEKNRELLTNIQVVVPVRPQDGLNVRLAQMLSVWRGEGVSWAPLNDHMGGFIELTRANIAYHFRFRDKEKFLLMIDNDMEPPVNLPLLLARWDKPIVGGCAMAYSQHFGPQLCFSVKDTDGNYRFPSMQFVDKIPARGLKEVGHVGTGAIMIRRDVLESFTFEGEDCPFLVPSEPRLRGMSRGFMEIGEDIAFCNQARAKGFQMYVDLEAHVGHRKTMSMRWDPERMDPNMDADSWVVPCEGHRLKSL